MANQAYMLFAAVVLITISGVEFGVAAYNALTNHAPETAIFCGLGVTFFGWGILLKPNA